MDYFVPKYRRNPNEKVESIYSGIAPGNQTVTTVVKPSMDGNHMEATKVYGPGLSSGGGGRVAVLVLGGMEATLAEVEDLVAAKWQKEFVPKRSPDTIISMARRLMEQRNEQIEERRKYLKANPSEAPKPKKKTVRLHLPSGYKMVGTEIPGLRVMARI